MGRADSRDSVVDPQLRVIGTRNLRVIDASVMPLVPISNSNAACMMLGEKGAQAIIDYWEAKSDLPEVTNQL